MTPRTSRKEGVSQPLRRRSIAALALGGFCAGEAMASLSSFAPAAIVTPDASATRAELSALEGLSGGRLGVFAIDTSSGSSVDYRADELFPMCSTHKVVVGAAILSAVEEGRFRLDQRIPYGPADILDYAPVTKENLSTGSMSVEALCAAAVRHSDNTADNLLLKLLGGPAEWTRYARSIGDAVSRLDRYEPELNSAIPGDPRDTSSPLAMNRMLAAIMWGDVLGDVSRALLKSWMLDSEITKNLIRAGLPAGWLVADKSGSGSNGTRNDVGILYPPRSAPLLLSIFCTGSVKPIAEREQVIAECARIAVCQLLPRRATIVGSTAQSCTEGR